MEILILLWLVGVSILICWQYRKTLRSLWREPVLRCPVLIIESDDWGPGPNSHAQQLNRLIEVLSAYRDRSGRHPRMTFGVVLAVPDSGRMRETNFQHYYRLRLSDPRFAKIRKAMQHGVAFGVFALQLHGMEHFWPPAVMAASAGDAKIRNWLTSDGIPNTEDLPSPLQSRWTDASRLPSSPIPTKKITAAAKDEVREFAEVFGHWPRVAVPPTFMWNLAVEKAWFSAAINVVVTPGKRFYGYACDGKLQAVGHTIRNGQRSTAGPVYVVRNKYFEPALGHTAQRALNALDKDRRMGRPTLLETHRFNFTGDPGVAEEAFKQLDSLLKEALSRYPELVFISTEELAKGLVEKDPALVETRIKRRIHIWLCRLWEITRVRDLACLSGLVIPAYFLYIATKEREKELF